MAVHDAYLRRTPYELAFPDAHTADEFVSAVATEAGEAGVDAADRQAFLTLPAVSAFLRRLQPEEARPEAMVDYAMLLYHAFRFARAGGRPLLVSEATARGLVRGEAEGSGAAAAGSADADADALRLPQPAGYAQFPRNLFWMQSSPQSTPEAVDGFFWSLAADGLLHLLLAAGVRDDRPGLAVVPVPEAPWADAATWLDAPIRPEGEDFATTLPGGELEALYSFVAAGEVLKLTARLFARIQANPGAATEVAAPEPMPAPAEPTPSTLSYLRI